MYGTVNDVTRDNGDTPQHVNQLPTRLVRDYNSPQPEAGGVINEGVYKVKDTLKRVSVYMLFVNKRTWYICCRYFSSAFVWYRTYFAAEIGEDKGAVAP